MEKFDNQYSIWLLFGTGNNRRYVNVTKMAEINGNKCKALAGFHSFTGCDYNPSLFKIGKNKPWKILEKSEEYINAFTNISDVNSENYESAFETIEKFVCDVYATKKNGLNKYESVNDARRHLFNHNFNITSSNESFKTRITNFDPSMIPPCKRELHQQLKRTAYISNMWCNATKSTPIELNPIDFGRWMTNSSILLIGSKEIKCHSL